MRGSARARGLAATPHDVANAPKLKLAYFPACVCYKKYPETKTQVGDLCWSQSQAKCDDIDLRGETSWWKQYFSSLPIPDPLAGEGEHRGTEGERGEGGASGDRGGAHEEGWSPARRRSPRPPKKRAPLRSHT